MAVGILRLPVLHACEDNCYGSDDDGVPCVDVEDPPCYEMCRDDDDDD